jgi:pimeloyl-ACP methyl ester carboxylesterase
MNAQQWFEGGSLIKINTHDLFVYDSQATGSCNKPVLLILHGYPTCSYDYYKALPMLEQHFRVIIHDHLGFGFSAKPLDYSYSLIEQADMALLLWQHLRIEKAHLLAHDYGTSIATEIMARDNSFTLPHLHILSINLCNGSMHIELAKLRLIQKLLLNKITGPSIAKLSSKTILKKNLKNIYYDPKILTDSEVNALWTMMTHNNGRAVLHQLTGYLHERYRFWFRWIGALKQTELPINIIWAKDDPVAVMDIAHTLKTETKHSQLFILEKSGHFPMLESTSQWTDLVISAINHSK